MSRKVNVKFSHYRFTTDLNIYVFPFTQKLKFVLVTGMSLLGILALEKSCSVEMGPHAQIVLPEATVIVLKTLQNAAENVS